MICKQAKSKKANKTNLSVRFWGESMALNLLSKLTDLYLYISKEDFGLNQILEDEIFIMYLVCGVVMVCITSFKVELLTIH